MTTCSPPAGRLLPHSRGSNCTGRLSSTCVWPALVGKTRTRSADSDGRLRRRKARAGRLCYSGHGSTWSRRLPNFSAHKGRQKRLAVAVLLMQFADLLPKPQGAAKLRASLGLPVAGGRIVFASADGWIMDSWSWIATGVLAWGRLCWWCARMSERIHAWSRFGVVAEGDGGVVAWRCDGV